MAHAPRRLPLLFAALLAAAAATAGAPAPPPKRKGLNHAQLTAELGKLVQAPALQRAVVGVAVRDLSSGEWLFESQADQLLIVASNNKLAATAAALELLGPDFQFRTTVAAVGRIAGGVLYGDLLLTGRGDPSISGRFHNGRTTAVVEQWAAAVAAAGIKSVRGGIIADDTYFDRQHIHPLWPTNQLSAWYCAPVGALSFSDNCVLVTVAPGARRGDPARVALDPPTAYVQVVNQCTTSRARSGENRVLVHRAFGGNPLAVGGEVREKGAPFRTWVAIHDPALYTATVFAEVLEAKKIPVGGPVRLRTPTTRIEPADCKEIVTTTSFLKDAVAVANGNSQNFYAEQILKTLGREKAGKGTWADGAEAVIEFLRKAGVTGLFSYHDGSGLARADRFSPRQIVQLLSYMNGRRTGPLYLHSLAEPGEPGTLLRRGRLDPLQNRVFAKTGYIAGVSALSGYLETRGGRMLAFSILVNDFRCPLGEVRSLQDALCLKLADYEP